MYYDDVVKAVQDRQPVNGYYGHTVISRLATMDMANSCPPEYMHCVLLGQVLSCLEAWFDSKNKKQPFYLGPKRAEFDRRMTAIRPPSEITRLPAKIGKDNKASQLKHILLYYSLPCLYGLMKDDYYNHWFLLVYGITLLLQDEVSTQDLDSAQKALEKFVQGIELLYGEAYMKYNTHLLLHVTNYARYFGGLWAWSAFPYETFNGVLAKLYHGSQHVAEQICKMSCRIRYIKNAAHVFDSESCDPAATRLFLELTTSSRLHRIIEHRHDLKVCGAGKGFQITTPFLRTLIENVVKFPISELSQSYERFIYKKKVFTTALYTRATLRTNHFVSMENGDCVKIMHLLCIKNAVSEEKEYVLLGIRLFDLGKSLCAHESFDARKIFTIVSETQDHVCYVYKSIKHKLVRIEMDNGDLCLVKIVNSIETD